jgi:arylsulfatase
VIPLAKKKISLEAHVNRSGAASEGVLLSVGDSSAGYVFYIQDNKLVFDNNNLGAHAVLVSSAQIPAGESLLRFEFTPGAAFTGTGALYINAEKSAQGPLTISPAVIGFGALEVGRNSLSPVSQEYASKGSFAFPDGELKKVVVNVSPLAQTASAAASQPVAKPSSANRP